jgi:hypothetical protein
MGCAVSWCPRVQDFLERQIARELAHVTFCGVSLGQVLDNPIRIDLRDPAVDRSLKRRAIDLLRLARWRFMPAYRKSECGNRAAGKVLVGVSTRTIRGMSLIEPVIQELGDEGVIVAPLPARSKRIATTDQPGLTMFDLLRVDRRDWVTKYRTVSAAWRESVDELVRCGLLRSGWQHYFEFQLMIASQRVYGFRRFLEKVRPRAILVDYDRNFNWACLVLAARAESIPTYTLVHGTPGDRGRGFVPILADLAMCWGQIDRDIFLEAGAPPEQLVLAGCPRLRRECDIDTAISRHAEESGGLRCGNTLLALSAHGRPQWRHVVSVFDAALQSVGSGGGIVRLHPSDGGEVFDYIRAHHPRLAVRHAVQDSLDGLLAQSDLVVTDGSGVGGDALVKRRLVIVLPGEESLAGHARVLVEEAGCPLVKSADELVSVMRRVKGDSTYRTELIDARERFVARFCVAFGEESAHRIAGIVMDR